MNIILSRFEFNNDLILLFQWKYIIYYLFLLILNLLQRLLIPLLKFSIFLKIKYFKYFSNAIPVAMYSGNLLNSIWRYYKVYSNTIQLKKAVIYEIYVFFIKIYI